MNKISTEKAIEVLYTIRAYYASLTVGYPKSKDCKGIEDVTCSEIANSCLMAIKVLEQESKIGHWIIIDDCEKFIAKCSECGRIEDSRMISKYPYCHCGAKMESGDKV